MLAKSFSSLIDSILLPIRLEIASALSLGSNNRPYYGISLTDNYLSFNFGRDTDDSEDTKQKGIFLPWGEWEHVRHTLYNLDGSIHAANVGKKFKAWEKAKESVEKRQFDCIDYDGMEFVATAYIEEMGWRLGVGWFKWLRLLVKPKVRRSLDLSFSKPIGKDKDSWTSGTIGHGINMLPSESVEAAFQRYCEDHDLTLAEPLRKVS